MKEDKYEVAVAALIAHPTMKEAAKAAGIGESTLREYRKEPEFMELYLAARREVVDVGVQFLQEKFSDAVETVCSIMHDEAAPPNVRLSAANSIIQNCMAANERADELTQKECGKAANAKAFKEFSSSTSSNAFDWAKGL